MFRFVKKAFLVGLTVLSYVNPLSNNQLGCMLMTNKECKVRPEIIMLIVASLYFILLLLKQGNVAIVVKISMIHMQKCVFLMW